MKQGQTLTSEKKKKEIVHVYVLLFIMCIVVAILTYIIPAGSYARETVDGQTVVVAGSYQRVEQTPVGIFGLFNSVAKGWSESASIIFLVFMVGGAIKVIEDTGVIDRVLTNSMGRLRGKEETIVILVSLILSIMGCTGTFSTANIAIVPIALVFSRRLGYDRFLAFALAYLAVNAGYSAGEANIFSTSIAQQIAELTQFSGMGLRIVEHVVFFLIYCVFIVRYMRMIKKDPSRSIAPFDDEEEPLDESVLQGAKLTVHQILAGLVLIAGFLWLIIGATVMNMSTTELTTIFFFMAVFGGLLGGLGINGTAKSFAKGLSGIASGAFIVGMAKAISVVMTDGGIIDSVVYYLTIPLAAVGSTIGAGVMLLFNTCFNLLISSGSGQAVAVMPIMVPIADLTGITRQVAVEAFKLGESLSNIIVPTAGAMMACLGVAKVPYLKYLKRIMPYFLVTVAVSTVFVVGAQMVGWQG